jgi:hypothetical protein
MSSRENAEYALIEIFSVRHAAVNYEQVFHRLVSDEANRGRFAI